MERNISDCEKLQTPIHVDATLGGTPLHHPSWPHSDTCQLSPTHSDLLHCSDGKVVQSSNIQLCEVQCITVYSRAMQSSGVGQTET